MTAFTATLAKCAHHRAVPLTASGEEVDRCGELRIEMQLERRLAKLDQTIAQSHVSMLKWMFVYWTGTVLAMAALNSRSSSADANVAQERAALTTRQYSAPGSRHPPVRELKARRANSRLRKTDPGITL